MSSRLPPIESSRFFTGASTRFPLRIPKFGTSLSAKLIAGFLLVTIPALSVMVAISLYSLRDLTGVTHQLQEISRSLEAVERLESAFAKAEAPLSAYLVDGTPGEDERFRASIQDIEARLKGCTDAACHGNARQPAAMTEGVLPFVQGIKDRGSIIFAASQPLTEKDKLRMLNDINRDSEEAGERVNSMSMKLLVRVASLQNESQAVSQRATTLILASVSLVVALAILIAWWLSRRLLKHVNELLVGTQHIKQGHLGYRVTPSGPDEIGLLAESFNAMAEEIQQHREDLQRMVGEKTAELKQAQDSLIQSEKLASIGLLASGVAHELNNPLTSILMNVNLLMEDADDRPGLKMELQRINEDTVRCKGIIDDLRNFSRRHDLDLVPTDLNRMVDGVLALLERRKEFDNIRVISDFFPGIPRVPCDPARMEEVLTNVFMNAVQAMPEGGLLKVSTALQDDFARISIGDTGCGIPAGIRNRIFDPFFTTKPQGTGLGLSIVYRIMEAHGGRIEVESGALEGQRDGELRQAGTEILLSLPLKATNSGMAVAAGD